MNKFLAVLSLSLLVSSCGEKSNTTSINPAWTTTNLSMNPVKLSKQDIICGETLYSDDEMAFTIEQFIDGKKVLNEISFKEQVRGNYVESLMSGKPIKATYYGADISVIADVTFDEEREEYVITPGVKSAMVENGVSKKLDVCKKTDLYESSSYEGSGLNISNSVTTAYNAVTTAQPGLYLKPVVVHVAPVNFKDIRFRGGPNDLQYIKGYDTDNAYYDPEEVAITFLPQSMEYQEKVSTTPFWEIPMVGAHEYGHHVFQTIFLNNILSEMKHPSACFENHTTLKNLHYDVIKSKRDNGMVFALGSMNEGFADLISYYSIGEKKSSLKGVICFEKNREVGSSIFGSYVSKTFSKKALDLINSEETEKSDLSCDTPDYQEIHNVGAIFAYGANKLISGDGITSEQKLKIILKWAKELAKNYYTLQSLEAGEIFFAALEMMKKISNDEIGGESITKKADCTVMNELFPDNHGYKCRYLSKP